MINRIFFILNSLLILSLLASCGNKNKTEEKNGEANQRTISFSGFEWTTEGSGAERISPGQNYFSSSEENVWVDSHGNLHLKITNRKGKWYCATVTMKESFAYNKYIFQISSRVDRFDKNVVGGLFIYLDDSNEIDIEFARWGIEGNSNSQFAVQPAHHNGNIYRYPLDLRGRHSTHIIDWKKDTIEFLSFRGYHLTRPDSRQIMSEWIYTGNYIPDEDEEKVMINLWLYNGLPPSDNKEVEMIIKAVDIY
ncbi:MAG: hypothetical protein E4G92_01960 [Bacteroidia bacterium]|nr:MAG: hypothetical protein E4G92_01960 [Bacteroidia bacterium]